LAARLVPAGTEVAFRPATLWEQYWSVIVGAAAIIVIESLLIGLLLLERGRRIRTQRVVEESKRQLAHMARVTTVGELTASLSHELRQPLAAIRAHAEIGAQLLDEAHPDWIEARTSFRDIAGDVGRASSILEHIKMLVRKEEPARQDVNINDICRHAAQILQSDAAVRGVRLRLSLDPGLAAVSGVAVQLEQVVLNLTLNALHAAQSSTGAREVMVGTAAGNGRVELFVRDSGPGLPPGSEHRVFEPFFSTKSDGLGMGLAIVRSIVERHRGQVRAQNDDGGGAVFSVVLPALSAPGDASGKPVAKPLRRSARRRSTTGDVEASNLRGRNPV
jgi:C4-dicarboxylate-specific signal transduction histidine kinase